MRLLLTRPDTGPEHDPLHDALVAAGHQVVAAPLLSITFAGTMPPLDGVQGQIATSRNGLKAVAPLSDAALALPLFAVGPGTAALGEALGFRRVIAGPGTGRALAEIIRAEADPAAGALVHLAGETLAFDLRAALEPHGVMVRTETVYRAEPVDALPPGVVDAFRNGSLDGVVLMSPRTARVYAQRLGEATLADAARRMVHFCLSDAVGRELSPLGTVRIAVAPAPNSQEMLALIAREASDSA